MNWILGPAFVDLGLTIKKPRPNISDLGEGDGYLGIAIRDMGTSTRVLILAFMDRLTWMGELGAHAR